MREVFNFDMKTTLKYQTQRASDKSYDSTVDISFLLQCPSCRSETLCYNGKDHRNNGEQRYKCLMCGKRFYSYTSYFVHQKLKELIAQIFRLVFKHGATLQMVAVVFKISVSSVSRLIYACEQQLEQTAARIQHFHQRFKSLCPQLQEVIYLDETFFRVQQKTYFLIIACDATGRVLAWELSRRRTSGVIAGVLHRSLQRHPNWSVLIADGAPADHGAFRRLDMAGILIQHFHSHPWEDVKISQFEPAERSIKVLEIVLPYNLFLEQNCVKISARLSWRPYFTERKALKQVKSRTPKKVRPRVPKKLNPKNNKKKRAEKNLFSVCPKTQAVSVRCAKAEPVPDVFAIATLIQVVAVIFNLGAIQSNLIESVNSQVKQIISTHGLKTEAQLEHRLAFFFHAHSGFDPPAAKKRHSLRSHHALKNWKVV